MGRPVIDAHCLETIRRLQIYMRDCCNADADEQIDFFGAVCTTINLLRHGDNIPDADMPDAVNAMLGDICDIAPRAATRH